MPEKKPPKYPNCQNCTWCLRDDDDTRWLCMYPYEDFGFEGSRCPKHLWRVRAIKLLQNPLEICANCDYTCSAGGDCLVLKKVLEMLE